MEIQKYIEQNKRLYKILLEFVENTNGDDELFQELMISFKSLNYQEEKYKFQELLQLISAISNHHQRQSNFYSKIEKIFLYHKDNIKQTFSNSELILLFQFNKLILLLLIKNEMLVIDEYLVDFLIKKEEKENLSMEYEKFFFKEIIDFIGEEMKNNIKNELIEIDADIFNDYEDKRLKGENTSYICQLIRNDSIDEFLIYFSQTNFSLSKKIKPNLFETNLYLIKNEPTIIEYSAFFGSVQIFRFLLLNNVKMTSNLWFYAIHGRNADIIHLLEENKVNIPNDSYEILLKESIKCHHNEIANYFYNNFIIETKMNYRIENDYTNNIFSYGFHYFNYNFIPNDMNGKFIFHYACQHNYIELVKILLSKQNMNINASVIFISVFLIKLNKR